MTEQDKQYLAEAIGFIKMVTPNNKNCLESLASSFGERQVLFYLNQRLDGYSAGQLSKDLDVKTSRMAAILKSLEKKNYIIRSHPEEDKRITKVSLTEEGRQVVERDCQMLLYIVKTINENIDKDELDSFKKTGDKIRLILEGLNNVKTR